MNFAEIKTFKNETFLPVIHTYVGTQCNEIRKD